MTESEHLALTCSRLDIAIQEIGVSQAEVCRIFGVSAPRLGNWLGGRHYPNPYFLARFCDRFGVTMDWFYRGKVPGVAGALADGLWAVTEASSGAPVVPPAPAPDGEKKKRGRRPKGAMAVT